MAVDRLRTVDKLLLRSGMVVLSLALLGTLRTEQDQQLLFFKGKTPPNPDKTHTHLRPPEIVIKHGPIFRITGEVENPGTVVIAAGYKFIEGKVERDTDFSLMTTDLLHLDGYIVELLTENIFPVEIGEVVNIYVDPSGVVYYFELVDGVFVQLSEAAKIERSIYITAEGDTVQIDTADSKSIPFEYLKITTSRGGKPKKWATELSDALDLLYPGREISATYLIFGGFMNGCCVVQFADDNTYVLIAVPSMEFPIPDIENPSPTQRIINSDGSGL